MKIGYIRISKHEQNDALQRDVLQEVECEKYFSDIMTGAKFERKGLEEALAFIRPGDTFVVWKLDRLGRSLKDLIETLHLLNEHDVSFISLTENIDTTTPGGKLIFHLMGALAEFERDLIRERTKAGLAAARVRGRVGGRPRKNSDGKVALAQSISITTRSILSLRFVPCLRSLAQPSSAMLKELGKHQEYKLSGTNQDFLQLAHP